MQREVIECGKTVLNHVFKNKLDEQLEINVSVHVLCL